MATTKKPIPEPADNGKEQVVDFVPLAEPAMPQVVPSIMVEGDAVASANTFVVTPGGFSWQLTLRPKGSLGEAEAKMYELFSLVALAEQAMVDAGIEPSVKKAPSAAPLAKTVAPGEPQYVQDQLTVPQAPAAPAPAPPAGPPAGGTTFRCVRIEVQPQPTGSSKIEFFGNDRKPGGNEFPTLAAYWDAVRAVNMFKETGPWTEEHFTKAAAYTVNYDVTWVNSDKLNSRGNPYKNVVKITKA